MKNKYGQPMTKAAQEFIKQHGGQRPGSGPKQIHTDPQVKERVKKFRATDEEWNRFLEICPDNSREAFTTILELLEK